MGQKVYPKALRLGITTASHEAKWFPKNKSEFAKFMNNDIKIRGFLDKKLPYASISSVVIERKNKITEITIKTSKPGLLIGKSGEEIEKLKKQLTKLVNEDIAISIVEIKKPDLDAKIIAETIANQIENRVSFRTAQKKALKTVMKAGAKGIKTSVSGRLAGADMARSEGYTEGSIPLHTIRADIDYATAVAMTTYGKLGVKVWIYKGEVLPNKKGGNTDVNASKN